MSDGVERETVLRAAGSVLEALDGALIGQRKACEALLAAYMANGHALLEGVPGIGKTVLARSFAAVMGLGFARIQFTPDLMPSDVVGTNVFEPAAQSFRLVRGPVFTRILMADEINRTPPKTQSALLEAMQERQVTIDGVTHPLDAAFFVVATENPVEFEGTYPLPEAQLDRFLLKIEIGLPGAADEAAIYQAAIDGRLPGFQAGPPLPPAVAPEMASALRNASRHVHVAPDLVPYLVRLADAVRRSPHVELGVSPRAGLALLEAARAGALLAGRDFVSPDDIKAYLVPAWAHRLILTSESELEGHSARRILDEISRAVEVPH
jgi:MoxR-like ATPase